MFIFAFVRLSAVDDDEVARIAQRTGSYDSMVNLRAFDPSQAPTEPLPKLLTPAVRQPLTIDSAYVFAKRPSDYGDLTKITDGKSNFHLVLDERFEGKVWPSVFDKFKGGGPNAVQRKLQTKISRFCVVHYLNQEFQLSFDSSDVLIWIQQWHDD